MTNQLKKWIVRVTSVLIAGILVGMIFAIKSPTFSFFSSKFEEGMEVNASVTSDFIESIAFEWADANNKLNPTAIIIRKATESTDNPLLYFSIDGEATNYILHINPIKLDKSMIRIPIVPNINTEQWETLWRPFWKSDATVNGTIKIKYLNEFIDESKTFTFTGKYLRSKINEPIDNSGSNAGLMTARFLSIQETGTVSDTVYGIEMNEKESELVNIIIPGMTDYLHSVENDLEEYKIKVKKLEKEKDSLSELNKQLEKRIKNLQSINNLLEQELNELQNTQPITEPDDGSETVIGDVYRM